jgi:uncharacterized protein (UPF0332 family)
LNDATLFLRKAEESLSSAEDDYAKERYNACARSVYYSAFHASIAALLFEGVRPTGRWEHRYVDSQFSGVLVYRRKRYPARFRTLLAICFRSRVDADYSSLSVPQRKAARILGDVRDLLELVREAIHGHRKTTE